MPKVTTPTNVFYLRVALCVYVIALGVVLYARATSYNTTREEVVAKKSTTPTAVPFKRFSNRFLVVGETRCDEPCLSALYSIDRVVDVLDKYGPKRRREAYDFINKHMVRFTNRNNGGYPVINVRVRRKGKTYIVNRVHPKPSFQNKTMQDMRKIIDQTCPDGTCGKRTEERLWEVFAKTSTKRPYMLGEYQWFSTSDEREQVLKKAVYYRYSKDLYIQAGYTVVRETNNTIDVPAMLLCYVIYASWVVLAFVYPGTLLSQAAHIHAVHEPPHSVDLWLLVLVLLVPYTYLVYRHLDAVRTKTDDDVTELTTLLVQARYSSLGMVGLVLALGLFIEYCPDERKYVFPALFLSIFYALLALLDMYTEFSGIALKTRNHIRNAFFIASVWSFVWLFVILVYHTTQLL